MQLSESAQNNGWRDFPAKIWNADRPQDLLHDLPFWQSCADQYGGPVLDLACGNGRISLALARQGYEVVGVDINPGLLDIAHQAATEDLKLSFRVGDIVHLDLDQAFGLGIMPDWTFPVLLTQADQIAFLERLHCHLKPGGAFAFNTYNPFWNFLGAEREKKWIRLPSISASCLFDPVRQIEADVNEDKGVKVQHRYTSLDELKLLLRVTGFRIVELFGDVDRRPFLGKKSDDFTLIAEKVG